MNARNFGYVALTEATTFLLLLAASYFKHVHDVPIGVQVLGPIHGLLFIAYVVTALSLRKQLGWSGKTTILVLIGAVVPFGGYLVERWLERSAASAAA